MQIFRNLKQKEIYAESDKLLKLIQHCDADKYKMYHEHLPKGLSQLVYIIEQFQVEFSPAYNKNSTKIRRASTYQEKLQKKSKSKAVNIQR